MMTPLTIDITNRTNNRLARIEWDLDAETAGFKATLWLGWTAPTPDTMGRIPTEMVQAGVYSSIWNAVMASESYMSQTGLYQGG